MPLQSAAQRFKRIELIAPKRCDGRSCLAACLFEQARPARSRENRRQVFFSEVALVKMVDGDGEHNEHIDARVANHRNAGN
jgi:hypothetical protein